MPYGEEPGYLRTGTFEVLWPRWSHRHDQKASRLYRRRRLRHALNRDASRLLWLNALILTAKSHRKHMENCGPFSKPANARGSLWPLTLRFFPSFRPCCAPETFRLPLYAARCSMGDMPVSLTFLTPDFTTSLRLMCQRRERSRTLALRMFRPRIGTCFNPAKFAVDGEFPPSRPESG